MASKVRFTRHKPGVMDVRDGIMFVGNIKHLAGEWGWYWKGYSSCHSRYLRDCKRAVCERLEANRDET